MLWASACKRCHGSWKKKKTAWQNSVEILHVMNLVRSGDVTFAASFSQGKSPKIFQVFNFFPMHRTLWDDRKFFRSHRVSHC